MRLIFFGSICGYEPEACFGKRGPIDVSVPADVALIIVSVGLMRIPVVAAPYREKGVLWRCHVAASGAQPGPLPRRKRH